MIEVTCPKAKFNNHRELYNKCADRMEFIKVEFKEDGIQFEKEMTVSEAEKLAKDLMDWVKEFKGEEDAG